MILTRQQLLRFSPTAKEGIIDAILEAWEEGAFEADGVNTPGRLAHFLAALAVDTRGLERLEEFLNLRPDAIMQRWPLLFQRLQAAHQFAHEPKALANYVYRDCWGNTEEADGWNYRASGFFPILGRSGYAAVGCESEPDELRRPAAALAIALRQWTEWKLNAAADADDLRAIRLAIKGTYENMTDSAIWVGRARRALVEEKAGAAASS